MKTVIKQNKVAIILLAAGVIFLCVGVTQGGYRDTVNKAVHVCLECIGIG